jgi:hypothetical protein
LTGISEVEQLEKDFTVIYSDHQLKLNPRNSNLPYNFNLFTAEGKLVLQESKLMNEHTINLNNLVNGVYLIEILSAKTRLTKKIIIAD